MFILSIETSCDETSAAVLESSGRDFSLYSSIVSSQVELHAQWGGVVPNLAAREHLKNIMPVIEEAMQKAKVRAADIDLIAVTAGPGLIPALLIGVEAAKTLSYLWQVPLIGIHHIEGHIYANFIPFKRNEVSAISNLQFQISNKIQNAKIPKSQKLKAKSSDIKFPALCLVVSGGHTQLVLMKNHLDYTIIGETLDDAAGEAFDKVARILGLGYPGGPAISAVAEKYSITNAQYPINLESKNENSKNIHNTKYQILNTPLPRPMMNSKDFNFSFSGLKTAVLYKFKELQKDLSPDEKELFVSELAVEFQQAAVDVLIKKTIAAAQKYTVKTIMLAGGVSANHELRHQLGEVIKKSIPNTKYRLPNTIYTGDNAAMIGAAAHFRWENMSEKDRKKLNENWKNLEAGANLKLEKSRALDASSFIL